MLLRQVKTVNHYTEVRNAPRIRFALKESGHAMNCAPGIDVLLIHEDELSVILHYVVYGSWNWKDFHRVLAKAEHLVPRNDRRTRYHVVDLSLTCLIPSGAVNNFGALARSNKPRQAMVILVHDQPVIHALGKLMQRLFPKAARRVRHMKTVQEAYALITRLNGDDEY